MRRVLTLLGISVLALLAWGLIVLASASYGNGSRLHSDTSYFLYKQVTWLVVALPCLFVAIKFDYHKWREWPWLTIVAYGMVVLLLSLIHI